MTTRVICLDGTGQVRTQPNPTNVALIFDAIGGAVVDGGNGSWETSVNQSGALVQSGKYLPGVGTQGNPILEILGQAFGAGIAEPIVRGYTYLSRTYAPGDDIIIIGFSRGAAAARALAGFVAGTGLLSPAQYVPSDKNTAYLRAIAAWYQYRAKDPALANQSNLTLFQAASGQPTPPLMASDFVPVAAIKAVGVFDTVSSVGVPQYDSTGWPGFDFSLADTVLSETVTHGFHALAADETRCVFVPTFWTPRHGVTQVIFPGTHSNVGGGYADAGLSDGTLVWMLSRLAEQGLQYQESNFPRPIRPNPTDAATDDSTTGMWVLFPKAPRDFAADLFTDEPDFLIDNSITQRWGQSVRVLPSGTSGPYQATGQLGSSQLYTPPS